MNNNLLLGTPAGFEPVEPDAPCLLIDPNGRKTYSSCVTDSPVSMAASAILSSPFRVLDVLESTSSALHSAASATCTMFSPARLFGAPRRENESVHDNESLRRVQMTKAFTQLRDGLATAETEENVAQTSPSPSKKKASPAKKKSAGARKVIEKSPKRLSKVKLEPTRRTRRTRSYRSGMYSEQSMAQKAWAGGGTARDPIKLI